MSLGAQKLAVQDAPLAACVQASTEVIPCAGHGLAITCLASTRFGTGCGLLHLTLLLTASSLAFPKTALPPCPTRLH